MVARIALVTGAALVAISWHGQAGLWPIGTAVSRVTGSLADPRVDESSAAARSHRDPAFVWTINDSGNPAELFAIDTTGRVVAALTVDGARNVDWEALTLGTCGSARPDRSCLYIGDVGANLARRSSVTLYRLEEPDLARARTGALTVMDSLVVRLEGGARDVESMVITPTGDIALISKGWRERPMVYRVNRDAWTVRTAPWVAPVVDTLPIPTGLFRGRLVTDASLSADGARLVVRTYRELYFFERGDASDWLPRQPAAMCEIGGLDPQGEGVTWWDGRTVLLTSERALGRAGPVTLVTCELP